jgi:hypothetical protein
MTVVARRLAIMAFIGLGLAISSPGLAQAAAAIPEPNDMTLLALAAAGVVIGRQVAKRRHDD